jgi:hypothetical protein
MATKPKVKRNTSGLIPFVKGQSGNPKGHPKGLQNRSTVAKRWLTTSESFTNPITGIKEVLTQEDIVTLAQIKEARKGNTNAYRALLDSAHGQPRQTIDLESESGIGPTIIVMDEKTRKNLEKIK